MHAFKEGPGDPKVDSGRCAVFRVRDPSLYLLTALETFAHLLDSPPYRFFLAIQCCRVYVAMERDNWTDGARATDGSMYQSDHNVVKPLV